MEVSRTALLGALEQSWTSETSISPSEWSKDNPARGQCVPTALVAQDYLGGELEKLTTEYNSKAESHYRNILPDGVIFDASRQQYPDNQVLVPTTVDLKGFDSLRAKRLSEPDTLRRYKVLKSSVQQILELVH